MSSQVDLCSGDGHPTLASVQIHPLRAHPTLDKAVVDMDRVIAHYTGIFAPLQDDAFFRQVRTNPELGTIVSPNGADVCPDVLYSFASGKPIFVNGERVLN